MVSLPQGPVFVLQVIALTLARPLVITSQSALKYGEYLYTAFLLLALYSSENSKTTLLGCPVKPPGSCGDIPLALRLMRFVPRSFHTTKLFFAVPSDNHFTPSLALFLHRIAFFKCNSDRHRGVSPVPAAAFKTFKFRIKLYRISLFYSLFSPQCPHRLLSAAPVQLIVVTPVPDWKSLHWRLHSLLLWPSCFVQRWRSVQFPV